MSITVYSKRGRHLGVLATPDELCQRILSKGVNITAGGCHEWLGSRSSSGYPELTIRGGTYRLHRTVLEISQGKRLEPGEVARHKCDNPPCINLNHLETGTTGDNNRDTRSRNRHGHGDGNPGVEKPSNQKIRSEQLNILRADVTRGISAAELADRYGVSISTIYGVANGWVKRAS